MKKARLLTLTDRNFNHQALKNHLAPKFSGEVADTKALKEDGNVGFGAAATFWPNGR